MRLIIISILGIMLNQASGQRLVNVPGGDFHTLRVASVSDNKNCILVSEAGYKGMISRLVFHNPITNEISRSVEILHSKVQIVHDILVEDSVVFFLITSDDFRYEHSSRIYGYDLRTNAIVLEKIFFDYDLSDLTYFNQELFACGSQRVIRGPTSGAYVLKLSLGPNLQVLKIEKQRVNENMAGALSFSKASDMKMTSFDETLSTSYLVKKGVVGHLEIGLDSFEIRNKMSLDCSTTPLFSGMISQTNWFIIGYDSTSQHYGVAFDECKNISEWKYSSRNRLHYLFQNDGELVIFEEGVGLIKLKDKGNNITKVLDLDQYYWQAGLVNENNSFYFLSNVKKSLRKVFYLKYE